MKYPEYDSPFRLTMSDITTQTARNIDEMCWQAVQRVGIHVNKDKLLIALKQDSERYRKAYANGYDTGYEKRDDELVRCKDCKYWSAERINDFNKCERWINVGVKNFATMGDWFCADGKRRDDDDDDDA